MDEVNNCRLLNLTRKGTTLRVVFERKFDTCDHGDYVIEEGTTHVVYATGKGPIKHIAGVNFARAEHGFVRTRLLKNLNPAPKMPDNTRLINVISERVNVPSVETTYW